MTYFSVVIMLLTLIRMYDMVAGLLTKKFLFLIQNAKDGVLDLNKTAEMLDVCFPYFLVFSFNDSVIVCLDEFHKEFELIIF